MKLKILLVLSLTIFSCNINSPSCTDVTVSHEEIGTNIKVVDIEGNGEIIVNFKVKGSSSAFFNVYNEQGERIGETETTRASEGRTNEVTYIPSGNHDKLQFEYSYEVEEGELPPTARFAYDIAFTQCK